MAEIKDQVFSWFIQKVLAPSVEIVDKPGFVITSLSEKNKETYLRDLFLEEDLFVSIESKIVSNYGEKGRQVLYSAGKKFGYIYSSLSNFTRIAENRHDQKDFLDFAYFLVRYITAIYAFDAKHEIDLLRKRFEIELDHYVVCEKNGIGLIMTSGGIAGIWAHMIRDKTVEGIEKKCQGLGAEKCLVVCQPYLEHKKEGLEPLIETDVSDDQFSMQYKSLNLVRPAQFAKNSLKSLLDSHLFRYDHGFLHYKDIRYFHGESHVIYLIEIAVGSLPDGEKVLFDACFEFGQKLQEIYGGKDYKKFIMDYFPALGWGDIFVRADESGKIMVTCQYYPWTKYSSMSKFIVLRGVLSGFISNCLGRKVEFLSFNKIVSDFLVVSFNGYPI